MTFHDDVPLHSHLSDAGWTEETESVFRSYRQKCQTKIHQHYLACGYFKRRHTQISIPSILLSSLVTFLTSYNLAIKDSTAYSVTLAVTSLLSTLTQGVVNHLAYNKRGQKHHTTLISYTKLCQTIEKQLLLSEEMRESVPTLYDTLIKEFDTISFSEPFIPVHISKSETFV